MANVLHLRPMLVVLFMTAFCLAQTPETARIPPSYREFGLHKLSGPAPLGQALLSSGVVKTEPLSVDDIGQGFNNISDLSWLKPHALESRVVLLGENHYYKYVHNVRNRIFFALNQWDYYPTLVLEGNFSSTAYIEHFLAIEDDKDAAAFIRKLNHSSQVYDLLVHVRRWNRSHPEKQLRVVCSDIEHGLAPGHLIQYLQKADPTFKVDVKKMSGYEEFRSLYPEIKKRIAEARKEGIVGSIPTATADYYDAVLENLLDSHNAYHYRDTRFNEYRQKAIIRNLTDDRFLGKYLKNDKFMLHGGSYHTDTSTNYPDGRNYLREGSFLEYEFPPTKGKTYCINTVAVEYRLGAMADTDTSRYVKRGGGHASILKRMKQAYEAGAIGRDEGVSNRAPQLHEEILGAIADSTGARCLRVVNISWDGIDLVSQKFPQLNLQTNEARRIFESIDAYLFIPRSPIEELPPKLLSE